jgi:hypothetical protein
MVIGKINDIWHPLTILKFSVDYSAAYVTRLLWKTGFCFIKFVKFAGCFPGNLLNKY